MIDQQILIGDCLQKMAELAEGSIDAIISDPPYGYSFMNKAWDIDVPSIAIFQAMFRVLKPGAFIFIMSAPRQDVSSKMIGNIAAAGFDIAFDPIEWAYASGFPKAQNIGKGIDNRFMKIWVLSNPHRAAYWESMCKEVRRFIQLKRDAPNEEEKEQAKILLKIVRNRKNEYIKAFRKRWAREAYQIILQPKKTEHWARQGRSYQTQATIFSQSRGKDKLSRKRTFAGDHNGSWDNEQIDNEEMLTAWEPISPEAKAVAGMYAASPKPARELIFVAQKPFSEPSNLDQAIKYRNGGVYYDRCRIPADVEELIKNAAKGGCTPGDSGIYGWNINGKVRVPHHRTPIHQHENTQTGGLSDPDYIEVDLRGRFPANLIVSDNCIDLGEKTNSTFKKPHLNKNAELDRANHDVFNTCTKVKELTNPLVDGCDFSDKFSLDRWWAAQISHLPKKIQKIFPFLIVAKPAKSEKNQGLNKFKKMKHSDEINSTCDNPFLLAETERSNEHPTVKPITLFSYLVALSPTKIGDIILDPFLGSGTTLMACHLAGRRGIGIELMPKYAAIAQARLKHIQKQKTLLQFAIKDNNDSEECDRTLEDPGSDADRLFCECGEEGLAGELCSNCGTLYQYNEEQLDQLENPPEVKSADLNANLGTMWQGR